MTFSALSIALLSIYVLLSAVNCTGLKYLAGGKAEIFTKPIMLISLMFFYLSMLRSNIPAPQAQWPIKTALIFYAIGDFCLIWKKKPYIFGAGVLSFIIGHIFYGSFFLRLNLRHSLLAAIICLAILIQLAILLARKLSKTDDPMARKMVPYSFFLIFLLTAIASTITGERIAGTLIAFAGGILFSISDAMIGIRATGQRIPRGESVLISYTTSQLLLVFGALLLQM